jgi:MHS family alpha-ketoglutarate permease-like MFS transporter
MHSRSVISESDAAAAPASELSHAQRVRAIIAGTAGNLVEWYDFSIYAFMALYFASAFFPEGDRSAQLLNVAGIYAAGFLIRPLGGWYFGRLADRSGRKTAMVVSVLLMGGGSLLIAILPTYASIGALAPLLLLVGRLAQGFSTGGQYGATATYLSEISTARRRGFYGSLQFVTLIGGQLSALAVLLLLQQLLSEDAIRAWGWRIPFVLGAVLAGTILLLRHAMHETVVSDTPVAGAGTLRELARYPRPFFIVFALTAAGNLSFYTFTTYMQKFLVNSAGFDVELVSWIMTSGLIMFMLLQPAVGALSDRIGRRTCLLLFSALMALCAVPLLQALGTAQSPRVAFALVLAGFVIISFYTSVAGIFKAELFPVHVRALGVGLGHSLASAMFGGTAEYVGLLSKQLGHEQLFYWYISGMCVLSLIVTLTMWKPRRAEMMA